MAEVAGHGAKFEYGDTSAVFTALVTGWTTVAEVTDISPPEMELDDVETTHLTTTNGVRTYQGGRTEPGESEVTMHYDATLFGTLKGLKGTEKNFRVIYANSTGLGWTGYVKGISTEIDPDGLTLMTIVTKVSGDTTAIATLS